MEPRSSEWHSTAPPVVAPRWGIEPRSSAWYLTAPPVEYHNPPIAVISLSVMLFYFNTRLYPQSSIKVSVIVPLVLSPITPIFTIQCCMDYSITSSRVTSPFFISFMCCFKSVSGLVSVSGLLLFPVWNGFHPQSAVASNRLKLWPPQAPLCESVPTSGPHPFWAAAQKGRCPIEHRGEPLITGSTPKSDTKENVIF